MVTKKIEKIVKRYIEAVKTKNITIEKVILFGSYADNRADEWSDIDIAIISPDFGKDKYLNECLKLREIKREINLLISPEPYSLEEYHNAQKGDFLYDEIIKKGKLIKV